MSFTDGVALAAGVDDIGLDEHLWLHVPQEAAAKPGRDDQVNQPRTHEELGTGRESGDEFGAVQRRSPRIAKLQPCPLVQERVSLYVLGKRGEVCLF
jgi:hypothetical protein